MLYVICGHGEGDPGALGNGYREADLTRMLGKAIAKLGKDGYVWLFDTDKNHYERKTLATLNLDDDDRILEIHLDSFTDSSAKGGHVIINQKFAPDKFDLALEAMIKELFPGRSQTMVKRGDLYNCNVSAQRGLNYRLVEFGFITNKRDVEFFVNNVNMIAERVLKCFGEPLKEVPKPKPQAPEIIRKEIKVDRWIEITPSVKFHIDKVNGVM